MTVESIVGQSWLVLVIVMVLALLVVSMLVARMIYEVREDRATVCAILRIGKEDWGRVRIGYGRWRLPVTMGHARLIQVSVPDSLIPRVSSMEDAVDRGVQMRDSLAMREVTVSTSKRRHIWTLT